MTAMPAIALFSWPLITLVLFAMLGPVRGLIWSTLVGYLFLPERYGFDLPFFPAYDKNSAIVFSLLLAALFFGRPRAVHGSPASATPPLADRGLRVLLWVLVAALLLSPLFTFLTNRGGIVNGSAFLPGMKPTDVLSMTTRYMIVLVPFLLARRFLVTAEHHTLLLRAMVILAVFYAFLVLFEVRMSPQLNKWFYGYFPHLWIQHLRAGGFRPLVFLDHGLSVGFFLFMATIAACALVRESKDGQRAFMLLSVIFIFGTLLLSKNLGAVMLALIFITASFVGTAKMQMRVAIMAAALVLAYPLIRHQMPIDAFTDAIASFAPERAFSLNYRLVNETALLERANEKVLFGWGGWSRAQIFDDSGLRVTVTDGTWIVVIGQHGWFGFLAYFGLMTVPIFFLARAIKRKPVSRATLALALIGAGNLLYLLPNSTLTPVNWLIFGAIAGFGERDVKQAKTEDEDPELTSEPRRVRYTRFGPDPVQPS